MQNLRYSLLFIPYLILFLVLASSCAGKDPVVPEETANRDYKYIYHAHASTNSVGPRTSYIII